jgi:hypothetical protein
MWEYKFLVLGLHLDQATSELNAEGEAGWEAVAVLPKIGKDDSWAITLMKRARRQVRQNPKLPPTGNPG